MSRTLAELRTRDQMLVVGLSGGSSCDGVDSALCEISGGGPAPLRAKLLAYHDEPYSAQMRQMLVSAADGQAVKPADLCRLSFRVGQTFARATERLMQEAKRPLEDVDLVGSHGQALVHLPLHTDAGVMATGITKRGSTLQIGEPAVIVERLKTPVVSSFRARDMAAGGQGGPLGPYVDYLLFSDLNRTRAVVNIGGITTVTYLRAGGRIEEVLAYESGPGCLTMDSLVRTMTMGKSSYDEGAKTAEKGRLDDYLLRDMLKHPYLHRAPPKSTSRAEFGTPYAKKLYEWGISRGIRPSDILRTVTEFTALALAESFRNFLMPKGKLDEIIFSGGGVLNHVLLERLRKEFGGDAVHLSEEYGIPPKAKQALVCAVLARETVLERPGNLPAATGAEGPRILGQITPV
jgi:anhydro-N-acetylmuramic acid kinase